jgi:hypothetical protein
VTLLDGRAAGATMAVLEDRVAGGLGLGELLDDNVARDARGFLDEGRSSVRRYSARGETMGADLRVAIHAFATPPRMVVFGAIDFSAALAAIATEIGYRVTIVDARRAFAQSPRFAAHAEVVVAWPQEYLGGHELGPRDAVLVFTHDRSSTSPRSRPPWPRAPGTSARSAAGAPTPTAKSACAPPGSREPTSPDQLALRPGHRRADAGRDGDRRARRDPRPARGPARRAPRGGERADPPARRRAAVS